MKLSYQSEGFHQYLYIHLDNLDSEDYQIAMLMQYRGTELLPFFMNGANGNLQICYEGRSSDRGEIS